MRRILVLLFLTGGIIIQSFSQESHCTSYWIVDSETGNPVADVYVWALQKEEGAVSNQDGFFQMCETPGDTLVLRHTSYQTKKYSVTTKELDSLTIFIEPKTIITEEVKISASRTPLNDQTIPGVGRVFAESALKLPSVLGEADVVRALQQLPGIQSVSEGVGGIFVRGGSPGQNRIDLDGMELMNPVHIMGIYSVFNPLITKDVNVYKGHSPVSVSSGLSSSIIVSSEDPLLKSSGVKGSVGNIVTNLTFSFRDKPKKFGVTAGVRRSYLELYREASKLFLPEEDNYFAHSFYSFYDFHGKAIYQPTNASRFSFSWYLGKDVFSMDNDKIQYKAGTNYGNGAASLQWTKRTGANSTLKVSMGYTSTWSNFQGQVLQNDIDFKSRFQKSSFGASMVKSFDKHLVRYGLEGEWHKTLPQDMNLIMIEDTSRYYDRFQNSDFSWFLEDTYSVLRALSLYAGIRGFYYSTWGPYTYEKEDVYQNFGTGEVADNDSYWSYSLALAYKLQNNSSIKVAWTRSIQLQHLASLSSMPLPNDLWMMASPHLAPQKGHQWSVEYNKETPVFSFSSAAFIRLMQNQLIFNVSLDEAVANFEDHFYRGKGRAYGIEMSVNKKIGNLQGFINYTLSKSERSFLQIFDGDWFNDKFDRTHDLSLMSTFKLSEKWSFSANWTYATGTSMTLPSGRMWMMGTVMNDYDGYNQFRLPDYHRLDLSASLTLKSHLFKSSVLDFSVINLYNRANPYFLFYKVVKSDSNYNIDIGATQISLFPIMPSVSWKFSF